MHPLHVGLLQHIPGDFSKKVSIYIKKNILILIKSRSHGEQFSKGVYIPFEDMDCKLFFEKGPGIPSGLSIEVKIQIIKNIMK